MKNKVVPIALVDAFCLAAGLLLVQIPMTEAWSVVGPWRLRLHIGQSSLLSHKKRVIKKSSIDLRSSLMKKRCPSTSRTYYVDDEWIVDGLTTKSKEWMLDIEKFKAVVSSQSKESKRLSGCFDVQERANNHLETIDCDRIIEEEEDEILWGVTPPPTASTYTIRRRTEQCLRAMSCVIVATITWITLRRFVVPGKLHPSWFIRCCLAIYRRIMRRITHFSNQLAAATSSSN